MHCGIPNRVQNDRALSNTFLLLKEKVMQNNVKKKKKIIFCLDLLCFYLKRSNICLQNILKHCDGVSQGNIVMFQIL